MMHAHLQVAGRGAPVHQTNALSTKIVVILAFSARFVRDHCVRGNAGATPSVVWRPVGFRAPHGIAEDDQRRE
jgi:hypothetical protein